MADHYYIPIWPRVLSMRKFHENEAEHLYTVSAVSSTWKRLEEVNFPLLEEGYADVHYFNLNFLGFFQHWNWFIYFEFENHEVLRSSGETLRQDVVPCALLWNMQRFWPVPAVVFPQLLMPLFCFDWSRSVITKFDRTRFLKRFWKPLKNIFGHLMVDCFPLVR